MSEVAPDPKQIFLDALERKTPEELQCYLDAACAGNAEVRARVEALLRAHHDVGNFLGGLPAPSPTVDEPITESPGTVIGPYKLLEQIGEGGMGTVWMAQQTEPVKRVVALKLIKAGMDSRQVIARFEAERQALALMEHAHIARVLDAGTTGAGRPYFVMDLVKGMPITRYCDEHRLTPRQRLELFLPVCQAVQHAHQKGIIHRDLKPSNVLVALYDGRPVPKVIDFGVAKAAGQPLTDKTLVTGFGAIVGTLEYMSPEQAEINQLDIDTRSDIYSLGVLLYELLTGSPPFSRKELEKAGMLEMLRVIREQEPSKPSTKLSTAEGLPTLAANRGTEPAKLTRLVRGELDWIVMKALEKDRIRRYETANGFAMDVQRYLADEPVLACPPSAAYRLRKFARRNKGPLTLAGIVLFFLVLLGSGIGWTIRDRAARETAAAKERQDREEALDREVGQILDEAVGLAGQGKWPEALAAVERADKLLTAAGRERRPERLGGLQKELSFARRLDEIFRDPKLGLNRALGTPDGPRRRTKLGLFSAEEIHRAREQDVLLAREFREFGIDVDSLEPAEAAARIGRTSIRPDLVRALDGWTVLRQRARDGTDPGWTKPLEVARRVDSDVWRNRVREGLLNGNAEVLEKLAAAVPVHDVPPATLLLLTDALRAVGSPYTAVRVLRQAQLQYPDDLWVNDTLVECALFCNALGIGDLRPEDSVRFATVALALRPHSLNRRLLLARSLQFARPTATEALAVYSKFIELAPGDPRGWLFRGIAYSRSRQFDKAIADLTRAADLEPKGALTRRRLGQVLEAAGRPDDAITRYREASRLDPDDHLFIHLDLAFALIARDRWDEAIPEVQESIRLHGGELGYPTLSRLQVALEKKGPLDQTNAPYVKLVRFRPSLAHTFRAMALDAKGLREEAIREYRKTLRLEPRSVVIRSMMLVALSSVGEDCVPVLREMIGLSPDDAQTHWLLGSELSRTGELDQAILEYRECLRLNPVNGLVHQAFGNALAEQGKWDEALAQYRTFARWLEVRRHGGKAENNPVLRRAEAMARVEKRLPGIIQGKDQPGTAAEFLACARVCEKTYRRQYAAAARFYDKAFAADPKLAGETSRGNTIMQHNRFDAARLAALAAAGEGKDAANLGAEEGCRLRRLALGWLRADLQDLSRLRPKDSTEARGWPANTLRWWLKDDAFAGVRGLEALAKLPEAERREWQALWADVADLLNRFMRKTTPEKKSK
jgi:serine/threonine protein kinase/tetratricopeptide (TPR) repeat protein